MSGPLVVGPGLIDLAHTGLRCRADPYCDTVFRGCSSEPLTGPERDRRAHELGAHGYTHVSVETRRFGFNPALVRKTR